MRPLHVVAHQSEDVPNDPEACLERFSEPPTAGPEELR